MKKNSTSVAILCLILTIFYSADASGSGESSGVIEFFKCDVKSVSISNINASPTQALFDDSGKPTYFIKRGSTELVIGDEKINIENIDSKKIIEFVKNKSNWKTNIKKSTDGVIVGLAEHLVNILIFTEKKWWLLRKYPNNISIIEVELIFDKNGVKIATIKMGEQPNISDDQEIINAFSVIMRH